MESVENVLGIVEKNPFCEYIGMEVLEVSEGYAKGRIHLEDKHKNNYGSMHGGCSYALADTIGGIAAITYGKNVTTVNAAMNYLLPVRDTEYVYCEARVMRHGRKLSVFHVTILDDKKKLLMDGNLTYYTVE